MVETIFESIRVHAFHPLDDRRTFTVDRELGLPGVAAPDDRDGRVRLLALRDLAAVAREDPKEVVQGLRDPDLHVRYLCAAALGITRSTGARGALEQTLTSDEEPVARAYAAMALGEAGARGSLGLLRSLLGDESHPDVRHQLELAAAQIESGRFATVAQQQVLASLDERGFGRVRPGDVAPDFTLSDVDDRPWRLRGARGRWLVLIWVFADWCPVCHREFAELMALRKAFDEIETDVVTLETHDTWRARLMVGREIEPALWGSKGWFREAYTERIWWPHLVDRAGAVGATFGTEPMAFAVHGEFVNRPTTIILDPDGVVRFAYAGTFWGDRPSIEATLEMIETRSFEFRHPQRLVSIG